MLKIFIVKDAVAIIDSRKEENVSYEIVNLGCGISRFL